MNKIDTCTEVSVNVFATVSVDKKTEKKCITSKDAKTAKAKVRPQPATERTDSSRLVDDDVPTSKTTTAGVANNSRFPPVSKTTVVATATNASFGITASEQKLTFHTQKATRVGCKVATSNQQAACGRTSTNAPGEQKVLATDRYALDDANYNIIAEKYRLFYSQSPRPATQTHDTGPMRWPGLKKPAPMSAQVQDRRKKRKRKDCNRCCNVATPSNVTGSSNDHDLHLEIKFDPNKGNLQVNNSNNNTNSHLDDVILMKKISP
ncbi:hypothetical protein NP493_367g02048 [Ridgeia piscesae]|uniref:Uncharacterized protein n=1 Tax=Ridgeia piscesae TaxID=27915 RepID=A0AAD9NTD1_RIDPI|nr:hypothetical protein NP493_367g02048 [Ridgeia piscesae]